jgi:hypothetical protein
MRTLLFSEKQFIHKPNTVTVIRFTMNEILMLVINRRYALTLGIFPQIPHRFSTIFSTKNMGNQISLRDI